MKSRIAALAALLAGLGVAASAFATDPLVGDASVGASKAAVCGACHGATGNSSNPEWPSLAGQHHQYLVEQLALFKAGVRIAPTMQPMAVALSPQDMADLGAYFEKQTLLGLEADADQWQMGEKLYRGGDAKRGIPACIGCHGPNGRGNGPARWPQVRAQHSNYLVAQLKAYAGHSRYAAASAGQPAASAYAEAMYDIAARLSEADVKALASYLQGLR